MTFYGAIVFFREKENEHDFKSEQGEKNHF
jgi:hypothetical protein